jgi:hypothetical protein
MGICRLVSLVVLLSTALIELDSSDDIDTLLLSVGVGSGLGVAEGVGAALELSSVVGNGEGVMYEVEKTVCGSCVTRGFPSGRTNVIADATEVKIVCWIGSTIMAVSASAICCPDVGNIVEVVLA